MCAWVVSEGGDEATEPIHTGYTRERDGEVLGLVRVARLDNEVHGPRIMTLAAPNLNFSQH